MTDLDAPEHTLCSETIARLHAEVREARNETATVRRAFMHERDRANRAVRALEVHDAELAGQLHEKTYRGVASVGTGTDEKP